MDDQESRNPEHFEQRPGESEENSSSNASRSDAGCGDAPPIINEGVPGAISSPQALCVKLQAYEGPLDLLLELIKKNEMDIYNIPMAEITRQYLDYLASMKQLNLDLAGEFLVMAATLIYIKSKMLLPQEAGEEEDEDGADPRAELVRKLLEYQAFKEAAKELGLLEDERGKVFARQVADYYIAEMESSGEVEIDTFSANLYDLLSAFQAVVARVSNEPVHEVFEEIISIEEKMLEVKTLLIEHRKIVFSRLFTERRTRNELIATFLALLEIVRSKFARVFQEDHFGEIVLEKL